MSKKKQKRIRWTFFSMLVLVGSLLYGLVDTTYSVGTTSVKQARADVGGPSPSPAPGPSPSPTK